MLQQVERNTSKPGSGPVFAQYVYDSGAYHLGIGMENETGLQLRG